MERLFRDSVLELAGEHEFARRLVNSGRLSRPCSLAGMSLQTHAAADGGLAPGAAMADAPVANGGGAWLLPHFGGRFAVMAVEADIPPELPRGVDAVFVTRDPARRINGAATLIDAEGLVAGRYGAGNTYLIRPDQHVAARFRGASAADLAAAHRRAIGCV